MLRKISIHTFLFLVLGLILISVTLSFWNRYVTTFTQSDMERSKEFADELYKVRNEIPTRIAFLSLKHAGESSHTDKNEYQSTLIDYNKTVERIINHLHYFKHDKSSILAFRNYADQYKTSLMNSMQNMRDVANDSVPNHSTVDARHDSVFKKIFERQELVNQNLKSDYYWSLTDNAIIQIILLLTSIPILITASKQLKREVKERKALLNNLHENNQKYLYHNEMNHAADSINNSIAAYQKIFNFVELVSASNYDAAQLLITENEKKNNNNTIIGKLIFMSEQLETNEKDKQQKQWVINGLNEFNNILRLKSGHLEELYNESTQFLCLYTNSLQGYLFVKNTEHQTEVLELKACFAYNKKKWLNKTIGIHEGLGGQALQEGEYILLKEIPQGYTTITSGLGEATPSQLLIVPGINNNEKEIVMEFASFSEFDKYKIEFLVSALNSLTATIQTEKNNFRMQELVTKSMQQAEVLREQEEELRQNMEELEATNEAMRRREDELLKSHKA